MGTIGMAGRYGHSPFAHELPSRPTLADYAASIFENGRPTRAWRFRVWRIHARRYIKSWRPRVSIRIQLFPRLNKRIAELELQLVRQQNELKFLTRRVKDLEATDA